MVRRFGSCSMNVRPALPTEDSFIVEHYMALWESYGTPADAYLSDARQRVISFLERGREQLSLGTFVATVDDNFVGSSGCQLRPDLYPTVVKPTYRLTGYIWQVYVQPSYRGKGIGRALTEAAIRYLEGLGCHTATLHYSEVGKGLYEQLQFVPSNEMRLSLAPSL